jgi:hypothetical protein
LYQQLRTINAIALNTIKSLEKDKQVLLQTVNTLQVEIEKMRGQNGG